MIAPRQGHDLIAVGPKHRAWLIGAKLAHLDPHLIKKVREIPGVTNGFRRAVAKPADAVPLTTMAGGLHGELIRHREMGVEPRDLAVDLVHLPGGTGRAVASAQIIGRAEQALFGARRPIATRRDKSDVHDMRPEWPPGSFNSGKTEMGDAARSLAKRGGGDLP